MLNRSLMVDLMSSRAPRAHAGFARFKGTSFNPLLQQAAEFAVGDYPTPLRHQWCPDLARRDQTAEGSFADREGLGGRLDRMRLDGRRVF